MLKPRSIRRSRSLIYRLAGYAGVAFSIAILIAWGVSLQGPFGKIVNEFTIMCVDGVCVIIPELPGWTEEDLLTALSTGARPGGSGFIRPRVLAPGARYPTLLLPFWFILIVMCIPTAVLLIVGYRRPRREHCVVCEYDLTGNVSGTCPECGTRLREEGTQTLAEQACLDANGEEP